MCQEDLPFDFTRTANSQSHSRCTSGEKKPDFTCLLQEKCGDSNDLERKQLGLTQFSVFIKTKHQLLIKLFKHL